MTLERTAKVNALTALLRSIDLGIDARKPLTDPQIAELAHWRTRDEALAAATARAEAIRLAKRITLLDTELNDNHTRTAELLEASPAAPLLDEKGIGPVIAAVVYTAWSHLGRVRSEAAFAALAGVSPIPASSGNTVRHRLNRGGDRRLNRAIHQAIIVRTAHDQHTRAYIERRTAEGKTNRREGLDRGLTDIEDSPLVLGAVPPGVPAGDCVLESLQAARSDGALAGP
jgi:transposase